MQIILVRNIRKNSSPWVAPAILVPKKISDGKPKFRFCVDFRALNAVTKFDPYPLPRFDETNSTLFGSKYFTFLDCYSGFWQINVRDNTRSEPHSLSPQVTMSLIDYPLVCLTAPLTSKDSWTWCWKTSWEQNAGFFSWPCIFRVCPRTHPKAGKCGTQTRQSQLATTPWQMRHCAGPSAVSSFRIIRGRNLRFPW